MGISAMNEKLDQMVDEKNEYKQKYQKLFATFSDHSDQKQKIKEKYDSQCVEIMNINKEIEELQNVKNNLIEQIKAMQDEFDNEIKSVHSVFNDKLQHFRGSNNKLLANKIGQIEKWKRK